MRQVMARQFSNKSWEYVINQFDNLSKTKSYVLRFRIDYYSFVYGTSSGKDYLKRLFLNFIGFASQLRYLIFYQFGKTIKLDDNAKHIVHLSDSNSFLKTILPVCDMLLKSNAKPVFLCPANHYKRLIDKLEPKITQSLFRYEQIRYFPNKIAVAGHIIRALLLGIFDTIWFIFQPISQSFATSLSFGRHAFVHHYTDHFWKHFFDDRQKVYLAAEDQYLWEASVFSNIKETKSLSFVFQHGKLSDVYYPTLAKKFCTLGEIETNKMIDEYKASREEICEVGSPCFDLIYNHYQKNPVINAKDNILIVFFAQPWYRVSTSSITNYQEVLHWFYKLSALPEFKKYKFILKLHPHDLASFYEGRPLNIELAHDNLLALIEKSVFTITVDSSSIFESAFCGIPSIQTIPKTRDLFSDESATGIALKANDYKELEEIGLSIINDNVFYDDVLLRSKKALNHYFSNLGHSLEVIKEILEVEDKNINQSIHVSN